MRPALQSALLQAALCLTLPVSALAQEGPARLFSGPECSPPVPADPGPVTVHMGDKPPHYDLPVLATRSPTPELPEDLDPATPQRLVLSFTLDTAGRVDLCSVRVLQHTDDAWTDAVAMVLPHIRYRPGRLGSRVVRVEVQQAFTYHPP